MDNGRTDRTEGVRMPGSHVRDIQGGQGHVDVVLHTNIAYHTLECRGIAAQAQGGPSLRSPGHVDRLASDSVNGS